MARGILVLGPRTLHTGPPSSRVGRRSEPWAETNRPRLTWSRAGTLPWPALLEEAGDFEMTDETRPRWFRCDDRGIGTTSRRVAHLRFRLVQVEPHIHLAVHRRRDGEVFLCLVALTGLPIEPAEAEVAVGDGRPHAQLGPEIRRLPEIVGREVRIAGCGQQRDLAEDPERPRFLAPLRTALRQVERRVHGRQRFREASRQRLTVSEPGEELRFHVPVVSDGVSRVLERRDPFDHVTR